MHQKKKDLQRRYLGFQNTQSLWSDSKVLDLQQFIIKTKNSKIEITVDENLRLGKYVEELVFYQLEQAKNTELIATNIQIQQEKTTLGELDCLLKLNNKPIHLEVVYKFYLYDETVGVNEVEHFIGPNRKDALIEKLTKLKEKQLPLLYSKQCKDYLESIHLSSDCIEQQVYFKAQLFMPYASQNIELKTLNTNCICGFYINRSELENFNDCKFHYPAKKDWLIIPHQNVNWLHFDNFREKAVLYFARKFSPLCWIKRTNGEIIKAFLVWW